MYIASPKGGFHGNYGTPLDPPLVGRGIVDLRSVSGVRGCLGQVGGGFPPSGVYFDPSHMPMWAWYEAKGEAQSVNEADYHL